MGVVGLVAQLAWVNSAAADAPQHHELENNGWQFLLGESAVGASAYLGAWLLAGDASRSCRWCQTNRFDGSVRNALRADDPRPPAFVSHALSVGAIPVLGLTGLIAPAYLDRSWRHGIEDVWIVTNSFIVTSAIGEWVKRSVARERPAFHYEVESQTEFSTWPGEKNKSFFSLDTAWAFAIASSSTTLAYLRGYSTAPYIAVGGGMLAVGAGTLRIVSDAHWATDVLTGAVVGTGIGIAMPLLLHARRSDDRRTEPMTVSVTPLTSGTGVSLAMQF